MAASKRFSVRLIKGVMSLCVTLFGLALLTFFIGRLLPMDPVIAVLGDNASQEAYQAMYVQLGLDQPLWMQFLRFMKGLITFDFGNSLITGKPVLDDIARVFPATIELATISIIIGTVLGVTSGVLAAKYRNTFFDHIVRTVSLFGYSVPNFWLGIMGLSLFYVSLQWVGGPGRIDFGFDDELVSYTGFLLIDSLINQNKEAFYNAFSHIILPASILGISSMAYIGRMTRSFMIEQLSQEYVITARAKGLSWNMTVWRHAFKNIRVQLITVVALSYAFLLEGAVLTETVFAWPGFGRYLTNALMAGDMNVVVACTLIIGLIFVGINMICDVLYRILDPRTR